MTCTMSHDIDVILDNDSFVSQKKKRRRTRKLEHKSKLVNKCAEVVQKQPDSQEKVDGKISCPGLAGKPLNEQMVVNDDIYCQHSSLKESVRITEIGDSDGTRSTEADWHKICEDVSIKDTAINNCSSVHQSTESSCLVSSDSLQKHSGGHRAGYDAFMTGFAMAHFICRHGNSNRPCFGLKQYVNRLCLSGKDVGLLISKSSFAKCSKDHLIKLSKIKK